MSRPIRTHGDHGVVVFVIGSRVHKWWQLHNVLWLAWAFSAMTRELRRRPELGCLDIRTGGGATLMLWRSKAELIAYARASEENHLPAWRRFNQRVRSSRAFGLWHEIYDVAPGAHTSLYLDMTAEGLGRVSTQWANSETSGRLEPGPLVRPSRPSRPTP